MTKILAVHNTTLRKLRFTDKLGGMPCPSIAYINADHIFDNFGDITLLCSPEMSNPAQKDLLSCDSDIYSSRFPTLGYDIDTIKLKSILKRGQEIADHFSEAPSMLARVQDILESAPASELVYHLNQVPEILLMYKEDALGEIFDVDGWPIQEDKYSCMASNCPEVRSWINEYFAENKTTQLDVNDVQLEDLAKLVSSYIEDEAQRIVDAISSQDKSSNTQKSDFEYFTKQFSKNLIDWNDSGGVRLVLSGAVNLERDYQVWSRQAKLLDRDALRSFSTKALDEETSIKLESWLESTFSDVVKKAYFRHPTPSGNVVKKKLDLETVTRIMKKGLRGGENFNYGAGNIRSKVAKGFRNWRSLENEAYRLVDDESFTPIREKCNDKLLELVDELRPFYKFSQSNFFIQTDDIVDIISEYAGGRHQSLREGFNLNEDFPKHKIDAFLSELRQMETQYFEGKFKRSVRISEFSAALVPQSLYDNAEDVMRILESEGLRIMTYDPQTPNDRKHKLLELASEHELVRTIHDTPSVGLSR